MIFKTPSAPLRGTSLKEGGKEEKVAHSCPTHRGGEAKLTGGVLKQVYGNTPKQNEGSDNYVGLGRTLQGEVLALFCADGYFKIGNALSCLC